MHGFSDVIEIHSLFETAFRVGIDTVRTLDRMGDSETDKDLFPLGENALLQRSAVPIHEFLEQVGAMLADFAKAL